MKYLSIFLIVCFISACATKESTTLPTVFDWNTYINQNIDSLDKAPLTFKKRIVMTDSVENSSSDSINLVKELSIFKAIKWNAKQALRYTIDSTLEGQRLRVSYTALDSNLSIQKMQIEKLNSLSDLTARVRITRKIDRPIYNLSQEFYFEPASGCYVKGSQAVPKVYDQAYEVYYLWDE